MRVMLLISLCLLPTPLANAQVKSKPDSDLIAQGKYIAENVALCVECHTPRDDNGKLLRTGNFKGAAVPVKAPPYPQVKWALQAPAIAGLPGYSKEEGLRLLMEGLTRDGRRPDPPMPQFRLNRFDAEAVVAYLKSLP